MHTEETPPVRMLDGLPRFNESSAAIERAQVFKSVEEIVGKRSILGKGHGLTKEAFEKAGAVLHVSIITTHAESPNKGWASPGSY